ncbi:RNA recognition motif domain-containing protein [Aliivibrio fischeri]|uniref:RNA-binding protein n=3 Tax=Aliivibrio fischeri TaxID=668 RepID=A0A1B9P6G5_ALIFS|nr:MULTISPECIES: RNA-binding protein [Aliivibrio]ACH67316.1 RNA-binding protein [Aliivibrio fischeri MJ11]EHN69167.1 RNA-binding protein [Aliivibrio fischeri SR5]KLU77577.1 RNA-binding protein [Aliivibrio fischeri]MBD1571497.1 RNA-binding protein [Aliivibrio sp. S10_S31]MBP3140338.1 RNA-binding protein [Aliivibrio fischeri]
MKSTNSNIAIIAIAALGAGAISLFPTVSPAFAFAFGAVITGFTVLTINKAPAQSNSNDSADTAPNSDQASTTLYVGNLPYRANESDVKELFAEFGDVFAVRLMKDKRTGKRRGFGFVVVATKDADNVIENLNNNEFDQRTLKVRIANDPKTSGNPNTEEN